MAGFFSVFDSSEKPPYFSCSFATASAASESISSSLWPGDHHFPSSSELRNKPPQLIHYKPPFEIDYSIKEIMHNLEGLTKLTIEEKAILIPNILQGKVGGWHLPHEWQSSYATDCRSVDPGANPGLCSNSFLMFPTLIKVAFQGLDYHLKSLNQSNQYLSML